MASGELLLELLSEEIPARMQRRAIDDLIALVRDKFAAAEIPATSLRGYVTPRRLTIIASGIPAAQPDRSEERRGPRVGSPQAALDGFLRGAGLASIEQCETRDTGRGEFYFAVINRPGRPAAEVVPELLRAAIGELPWPKSMRYPAASLRWVRPLISAICLLDGEVLPLALDRVPVGRTTRGHRFLSEGDIEVANASDYLAKLEAAHVVLDHEQRRRIIEDGLCEQAAAARVTVKPDPGLLDEVTGLAEYPVVLMGTIDAESMALPPEVLSTAMRTHQKYFSCLNPDGTAAPRFLFVANNQTPDNGRTIIAGNERVLRARLADARFFWDQDRKVTLESRVPALKDRVYHAKLGSVYDKVERIEKLAAFLAPQIATPSIEELAVRAAHLAKADLSTGMVGEFPELQGVMGRYYALASEDGRVADAIADQYKPLGPNDTCPTTSVSVAVALSDKIDSLVSFFAIGEKPTGSRDPFALRRAALGIIRIILENRLRIDLCLALGWAIEIFLAQRGGTEWLPLVRNELLIFIADRLKVHLREKGVRHDLIASVFALGEYDLLRLLARADAVARFIESEDGANLLIAYRRAANIVSIEEQKGGWAPGEIDRDALPERAEQYLNLVLNQSIGIAKTAIEDEEFAQAMSALAELRAPIDEFFAKVTVNTNDPALRENRLRLLSRIRAVMNQVADFSQIEG